jgi:para-nitrobenzyl esterase
MTPTVETSCGTLAGVAGGGVLSFRGIPFAAAPVGDLRYRPPRPPRPWTGVRDASRPGAASLQPESAFAPLLMHGLPPASEDCLYLNVWTPATDGARRPVMVWFHGGAFISGSGWQTMLNGARLAARGDVVVVTINYRLGIFGFLRGRSECGEAFDASGNEALLDQVAALEWVRAEIAAFGGDPANVTVFGASAGAASIAMLLSSGRARGLFHRAILQSGSANLRTTPARAADITRAVLTSLALTPETAGRLREVPAEALAHAQQAATPRTGAGTPYMPVADGDLIPVDPFAAIADGSTRGIPVLIGTNRDEMRLFGLMDPALQGVTAESLIARLAQGGRSEERASELVAEYRDARAPRGEPIAPADLLHAINSDATFRLPAIRLAEAQARHAQATYSYLFTWPSPWEGGRLGSCHALEGPFVFGTHSLPGVSHFAGTGQAADQLSEHMMDAWVAFARSGNPSHPGLPAWRAYEPGRRATMLLGESCELQDAPMEPERAAWDASLV